MADAVQIEPLVAWPREAAPGQTYLMTVDVRLAAGSEWRYAAEEYAVLCMVSANRSCRVGPLGEAAVMLHRFGGTYGPAQFLISALEPAEDARLRLTLVNQAGMPIANVPLTMRIASGVAPVDAPVVKVADVPGPASDPVFDPIARFAAERGSGVILITGTSGPELTAVARRISSRYDTPAFHAEGEPVTPDLVLDGLYQRATGDRVPRLTIDILDFFERVAAERDEPLLLVVDDLPPRSIEWFLDEIDPVLPDGQFMVFTARSPAAGTLLSGRGDLLTIALSDTLGDDPRATAAYNLGLRCQESGDLAGAEEAWRRAADLGHPAGANHLGALLSAKGSPPDAEAAWRLAAALGDADAADHLDARLRAHEDQASVGITPRLRPVWSPPSRYRGPMIDREQELLRLRRHLLQRRDVAIVGPAGSGKTHLAMHALTDDTLTPPGGVVFVDGSAAIVDLLRAVFDQLFDAPDAATQAIRDALREVEILLVVDPYTPDAVEEVRGTLPRAQLLVLANRPAAGDFEVIELGGLPPEAVFTHLGSLPHGAAGELLEAIAASSPEPSTLLWAHEQLRDASPGSRREHEAIAAGYERLAAQQRDRTRPDDAERFYRRALARWDRLREPGRVAEAHSQLAWLAEDRSDLDGAWSHLLRALELRETVRDEPRLAGDHRDLARVARKQGDLDRAGEHYRRALEISERREDQDDMAGALRGLAYVSSDRGELDEAVGLLTRALEISERDADDAGVSLALFPLASAMQQRGDLDEAERLFRRGLEIEERLGDVARVATHWAALASVARQRSDAATELAYRGMAAVLSPEVPSDEMERIADLGMSFGPERTHSILVEKLGESRAERVMAWLARLWPA